MQISGQEMGHLAPLRLYKNSTDKLCLNGRTVYYNVQIVFMKLFMYYKCL